MNYLATISKLAWGLLLVLCLVGLSCLFIPKLQALRELHRRKEEVQSENLSTESRIRDLRTKRERFASDPAFVERVARESGMLKSDETVFKFVPEENTASTP